MRHYKKTSSEPFYLASSRGLARAQLADFNAIVEALQELGLYNDPDCILIRDLLDARDGYNRQKTLVEKEGVGTPSNKVTAAFTAMNAYHRTMLRLMSDLGLTTMARKKLAIEPETKETTIAELLMLGDEEFAKRGL